MDFSPVSPVKLLSKAWSGENEMSFVDDSSLTWEQLAGLVPT